jgi:hypothetical protein
VAYGGSSAGDMGYNRAQSADALRRMRQRQADDAAAMAPSRQIPSAPPSSSSASRSPGGYGGGYSGGGGYGTGSRGGYSGSPNGGWYRDRGWQMPGNVLGGRSSFGIWDAAFMWFMFSSLSQPGHADFFRNHQNDAGYREWRQEAEQRAQSDSDIRAKLNELDQRVAAAGDQPRDPNYLPPGVPASVATGRADPGPPDRRTPTTAAAEEGGLSSSVVLVVLVGGAGLAFLAWRRSRAAAVKAGNSGTAGTIASAAGMLRHKASGEPYQPSRFRVGMTIKLDPTPFLLAAGATHLPGPPAMETVSVTEVGRIEADGLVRLYLPDGGAMMQLHLGAANEPDECRYFAPIDQITPADEAEWGVWLDPREGMIGWPEFQTKDGKVYVRIWSPGSARTQPRLLVEQIEGVGKGRAVQSQAMLYGAPTDLPAPAPPMEYILVSAVEDAGQAWVEVRAGIDINPASLSLA